MKFQFLNWQTNLLNNIQTYSKTFLNGYLIFICGIYTPGVYKEFNTALTCLVLRFTQKKNDIKKGMWRTISNISNKKIMVHIYRKCLPLHILTKDW